MNDTSGMTQHWIDDFKRSGCPDRVAEILGTFKGLWAPHVEVEYGETAYAHIVIADFNLETDHIEWCIKYADENSDLNDPLAEATKAMLRQLLAIPEKERDWLGYPEASS